MERKKYSDDERGLDAATIHEFVILRSQLRTFYNEISLLSKKSPDGPVNKFKLGLINVTLKKATALLGASYRPFAEFETFAEDALPTTSDVGMILSQYLNSMVRFQSEHSSNDILRVGRLWNTKDGQEIAVNGVDG